MIAKSIIIEPVLNGWVVRVGCQRLVFTNIEALLDAQRNYFHDPAKMEKLHLEAAINKPGYDPIRSFGGTIPEVGTCPPDAELTQAANPTPGRPY